MTRRPLLLCFLALALLALTFCKPQTPSTDSTDVATPVQVASMVKSETAVEPTMAVAGVRLGTGNFDRKAFAGRFSGTLPCADCPGIDETLQLDADGRFELTDVYLERPGSTRTVHGTWSAGPDGAVIHLVPGGKGEVDRVFAVDDHDTLTQLGMDGTRIRGDRNFSLKRGE